MRDLFILDGMFGIGFRGVFTSVVAAMAKGDAEAELVGNCVEEWRLCGDGSWCAALRDEADHNHMVIWRCKPNQLVDAC